MKRSSIGKLDFTKLKSPKTTTSANSNEQHFKLVDSALIKLNDKDLHLINYKELKELKLLGSGEFGIVKKMVHEPTKLEFAVKIIRENLIESSENKNSSIMDIQVSVKLGNGCSNLVRFYGALYADESYLILTELMDTSLDRFYSKAFELKLTLPDVFYSRVSESVLNALSYMKKLKLLHRDIKPSNILLNSNGEIKVCDFGISGFTTDSICRTFKGCQCYMAPEKIRLTDKGYSIKSDIWSLGISLIEISTGNHPFSTVKGVYELTTIILEADSPRLDPKKFSKEFCTFVDKCLIKDCEQRSNLDELMADSFIVRNRNKNNSEIIFLSLVKFIIDEIK